MNIDMSKIYERNPDTGEIRSRNVGDYGNEKVIVEGKEPINMRESILSDIWAANKRVVDGKWYVELSQVAEIIGGDHGRK
tara:strand:+ start:156 stop:395 length:240 start_codon:yes stop_codon:yes gene_type:complete